MKSGEIRVRVFSMPEVQIEEKELPLSHDAVLRGAPSPHSQPLTPRPTLAQLAVAASCRHRHCSEENPAQLLIPSSPPSSPIPVQHLYQHPPADSIKKPQQAYLRPHRRTSPSSSSAPSVTSAETVHECCAPVCAQPPTTTSKMGLSKTQRICILLAIDAVFFLVELICG